MFLSREMLSQLGVTSESATKHPLHSMHMEPSYQLCQKAPATAYIMTGGLSLKKQKAKRMYATRRHNGSLCARRQPRGFHSPNIATGRLCTSLMLLCLVSGPHRLLTIVRLYTSQPCHPWRISMRCTAARIVSRLGLGVQQLV